MVCVNYDSYLKSKKDVVGMIHLEALPGTPKNCMSVDQIIKKALMEAKIYNDCGLKTVMIENMHDVPYTKSIGPEIVSVMSIIGAEIKKLGLYCGIQILAGANKEAMAVAKAANLDFVRAEAYVFGHLGDEGYFDSCAGELLRYRRQIGCESLVFVDIKKKHSSHAITQDISLAETARAAEFFLADGVIITGESTGLEPKMRDLDEIEKIGLKAKVLIGSGLTVDNIKDYYNKADIFIVGSYFKRNAYWENELDWQRITSFMLTVNLCEKSI